MTTAELKSLKAECRETFREYYQRFREARAQVRDITHREVIDAFTEGTYSKWMFEQFCGEDPKTNEEFNKALEKLILAEEKTRRRFPDNRDNFERRERTKNNSMIIGSTTTDSATIETRIKDQGKTI